MLISIVLQYQINARLMPRTETALNVSRDTILLKENVSFLNLIMPNLQMLDVLPGIGTVKNVWSALKIGSSTPITFVCQFLTNARPMLRMETALNASRDTI